MFKQNEIITVFDINSAIPESLYLRIGKTGFHVLTSIRELKEKDLDGILGFKEGEYTVISYRLDAEVDGKNISEPFNISRYDDFSTCVRIIKLDIIDEIFPDTDTYTFPVFEKGKTVFRLFSPTSRSVNLLYYASIDSRSPKYKIPMNYDESYGIWKVEMVGNHHGISYQFEINNEFGIFTTIDPYSIALSHNSKKSVIVDLESTNPRNWISDGYVKLEKYTDAVIYETHIRDMTSYPITDIKNKRKYEGFTESGRTDANGNSVGIDHISELGATHVHLLPVQDFGSVDDSHPSDYNWGYDPLCHTVPEGSYSSNPHDPASRIREFKSLISNLHDSGLGVVMDVVYNHSYETEESVFNRIIPYYFYRMNCDGSFSNGSGCGNEIASERRYVRKFICDTLSYWQTEYHVDGFRFDLMGLFDIRTMKTAAKKIIAENKSAILYGEPWVGGVSTLPEKKRALKNIQKKAKIAVFNDNFRNAIKGFPDDESVGFVNGNGYTKTILVSMLGSIEFDKKLHSFCDNPTGTVNYSCCHDNLTLHDKLFKSTKASREEIFRMNKLTAFIVTFSFGIPFFMSGEEFMRTKFMEHNTYNLGDIYNTVDWTLKYEYNDLFAYYRNLLYLRKKYPQFRIDDAREIKARTRIINYEEEFFSYLIGGNETESDIIISINNSACDRYVQIPDGEWNIFVNNLYAGDSVLGICSGTLFLPPKSWFMLVKQGDN